MCNFLGFIHRGAHQTLTRVCEPHPCLTTKEPFKNKKGLTSAGASGKKTGWNLKAPPHVHRGPSAEKAEKNRGKREIRQRHCSSRLSWARAQTPREGQFWALGGRIGHSSGAAGPSSSQSWTAGAAAQRHDNLVTAPPPQKKNDAPSPHHLQPSSGSLPPTPGPPPWGPTLPPALKEGAPLPYLPWGVLHSLPSLIAFLPETCTSLLNLSLVSLSHS